MRRTLLVICALALSACATMDKEDCVSADWRTFGLEDGASGRMLSSIGAYREACAEYGVTPDLAEYQAGHAIGARSFCTPSNGFARGRAGADGYENFCPKDLAPPFLDSYRRGRTVYAADQRLARARNALDAVVSEIKSLDDSIIDYSARVAADNTPTEERVRLAKDLVEMTMRRSNLSSERPQREHELAAAESNLTRVLREAGQ